MFSEKKFRERAKVELREIGSQVASLARDRDFSWKLEREIIGHNLFTSTDPEVESNVYAGPHREGGPQICGLSES